MPGATANDEQGDRRREQQDEAVAAEREAEDHGGPDQAPIGTRAARSVESLPVHEQHEQEDRQRQEQGVDVGVGPDRPGDRRGRQEHARGERDPRPPGQPPDQDGGQAGGDGDAGRIEQVHPEGGVAERLEDDRREPAQDDPGREPGRVAGPEKGADRLELGGVPERHPRQERRHRQAESDQTGAERGEDRSKGRRRRPLGRHHPYRCPQVTPQATIAIDRAIRT